MNSSFLPTGATCAATAAVETLSVTAAATKAPLKTEDLGKIFEMAICLVYGVEYDGKYKYGLEAPTALVPRLTKLTELFPKCVHTAKRGARYDYTSASNPAIHLSAKTTKGNGKVAPQVVGQAQPAKFCEVLGIPYTDVAALKLYIQEHITAVIPGLLAHTLDGPTVYYNEATKTIRYITMKEGVSIPWDSYAYSWTCPAASWANSSVVKIVGADGKAVPLLEFQFHSKSRTNMAVRWSFEEFLVLFKDYLVVVDL
jgi:hypothetical protein